MDLTKGKACPTNLVALHDNTTGSVIEGEHWMLSTTTLAGLSILSATSSWYIQVGMF